MVGNNRDAPEKEHAGANHHYLLSGNWPFQLAIGASMAIQMEHILIVVSSLAIGSLLGEWWNLEKGAEARATTLSIVSRLEARSSRRDW